MRRPLLAAALALAATLAACGGGGGGDAAGRYDDASSPFTFDYPAGLEEVALSARELQGRDPVWRTAVGVDADNAVVVATYRLAKPAEQYDPKTFLRTLDRTVRTLARAQRLQPGERKEAKVGGLDGYAYELSGPDGVEQRVLYAFRGRDQLYVRCAWEPDPELQKQIGDACTKVQGSVRLRDPS